jgi:putative membrane protein
MLLHLGLVLGAAPLIAALVAARFWTPLTFHDALGWYGLAAAVEMLAVWAWHIPALHDLAGRAALAFGAEQVSFLLGGATLWTAIFTARNLPASIAAILVVALTFAHMTMFGLLLAIVPNLLYDPSLCQGGFGLGPLEDQHLGGALMAAGGLAYLTAAAGLVGRMAWLGAR